MSDDKKAYMKDYVRNMLGLGPSPGAASGSAAGGMLPPIAQSALSANGELPTPPRAIKAPHPEVIPEIVSTPSDVGLWGISHDLKGGQGSIWKKLFQDPREARMQASPGASPPMGQPPSTQ